MRNNNSLVTPLRNGMPCAVVVCARGRGDSHTHRAFPCATLRSVSEGGRPGHPTGGERDAYIPMRAAFPPTPGRVISMVALPRFSIRFSFHRGDLKGGVSPRSPLSRSLEKLSSVSPFKAACLTA